MNWNQETPMGDVLVVIVLIVGVILFIAFTALLIKGRKKLDESIRKQTTKEGVRNRFKEERWRAEEARRILKEYGEGK
jgi:Tfp pilus assembly protein PilO